MNPRYVEGGRLGVRTSSRAFRPRAAVGAAGPRVISVRERLGWGWSAGPRQVPSTLCWVRLVV